MRFNNDRQTKNAREKKTHTNKYYAAKRTIMKRRFRAESRAADNAIERRRADVHPQDVHVKRLLGARVELALQALKHDGLGVHLLLVRAHVRRERELLVTHVALVRRQASMQCVNVLLERSCMSVRAIALRAIVPLHGFHHRHCV